MDGVERQVDKLKELKSRRRRVLPRLLLWIVSPNKVDNRNRLNFMRLHHSPTSPR